MSKTIRRIISDIVDIEKNPVDNIYIKYNKTDIYKIRALIVGPIDSPYHYGNFFFEINFPKDYPNSPPKVIFKTINNKVRFNPNLYKDGKVCLSIINTWSGPGWTSACTLKGILLTIQSILHQNPIINEPGYEDYKIDYNNPNNKKSIIVSNYNLYINYHSINLGILDVLEDKFVDFIEFKDKYIELFLLNYSNIKALVENYKMIYQNANINIDLYYFENKNHNLNFNELLNRLNNIYNFLINDK